MIVMIGDSSVGKSCMLRKFVEPDVEISIKDNHIATVGVDFIVRTLQVKETSVKLQVWDTAGQERFRSVTSAYYRGAMGAVICYDCLDQKSFDNAETWITDFCAKARENAPMILVATKKDLINEDSNLVPPKRGRELAEKYNAKFFETSAYTGENVYQVFQQICADILLHKNPKPEPPQKNQPTTKTLVHQQNVQKSKGCC